MIIMWVFLGWWTVSCCPGLAFGQVPEDIWTTGQNIYEQNCSDCHRSNGEGLAVKFPALKGNPFVTGDPSPLINLVLHGRRGKRGYMPAWKNHLQDKDMAALLSYIRNAWGNKASQITPEEVSHLRQQQP